MLKEHAELFVTLGVAVIYKYRFVLAIARADTEAGCTDVCGGRELAAIICLAVDNGAVYGAIHTEARAVGVFDGYVVPIAILIKIYHKALACRGVDLCVCKRTVDNEIAEICVYKVFRVGKTAVGVFVEIEHIKTAARFADGHKAGAFSRADNGYVILRHTNVFLVAASVQALRCEVISSLGDVYRSAAVCAGFIDKRLQGSGVFLHIGKAL